VHYHFGIGFGAKNVALFEQVFAKFLIVINLSIENYPDSVVLVGERLVTSRQINDRKAAKPEADLTGEVVPIVIWTTMRNGVRHRL
jgi:hypothetical protein